MAASVVSVDRDVVTLEVKVQLSGSMLEAEERILAVLNEAGCLATGKRWSALMRTDLASSWGGVKWFPRGSSRRRTKPPTVRSK